MGFLVSQHGQLGAIPPPLFLSVSPLESMRSGGAIPPPPPQNGYLSDTCAIPFENKANGCDTRLCGTISKGYCAIGGGISHWASKLVRLPLGRSRACPGHRPRLSQTQVFSLVDTAEAQFVPGTYPVCPRDIPSLSQGTDPGRRAAEKMMC